MQDSRSTLRSTVGARSAASETEVVAVVHVRPPVARRGTAQISEWVAALTSAHHASAAALASRRVNGVPVTAASVNSGTARSSWAYPQRRSTMPLDCGSLA